MADTNTHGCVTRHSNLEGIQEYNHHNPYGGDWGQELETYETFVPDLSSYMVLDDGTIEIVEPYTEREFTYSHFSDQTWIGIFVYFDSQGDVRWKQNDQLICLANEVQFDNLGPKPEMCGYCRFLQNMYGDATIKTKLTNNMEILL